MTMTTLEQLQAGQLSGAKTLKLSCELTAVPKEIFELADSLELLVLSNNQLSTLPDEFAQLKRLKIVFFNNNNFTEFPEVLARCPLLSMVSFKNNQIAHISESALSPSFRWLILTDNNLTQLPRSIGQLSRLQKLMLAGNQLQALPAEMANCQNLELTRLSANQLQAIPNWLLSLPKLSWLAYAGNPFCQHAAEVNVPTIDTDEIELQEVLGEGASGVIYKATRRSSESPEPSTIAVKLFKGSITSDGLPQDEMMACLSAGHHANLVNVQGQLSRCIDDKSGLVFSFIPADYVNLGGPPSLESCTRDTYPDATEFSLAQLLNIAKGIAAATQHLHRRGISHGDLYAHNILVDDEGNSILGDFGAASFYDPQDTVLASTLERLEARAFGCLLEDLLVRCSIEDAAMQTALQGLLHDCMQSEPAQRPSFSVIHHRLLGL